MSRLLLTRSLQVALMLSLPLSAQAHRTWLLPSATVLSGDSPWLTVDAAVSNDLFYFEHVPLRLDGLQVLAPDATRVQPESLSSGKYRSSFDVHLAQPGTWKLTVVSDGLMARWQEQGEAKRWRGSREAFAREVPAGAEGLEVSESLSRTETFVTLGKPTRQVLKTSGRGLELSPLTHPNDLVSGEKAGFRLLLDGKPAAGLAVSIVPGGIRYRDQLQERTLTTDADGLIEVSWSAPGMYWLNASAEDAQAQLPGAKRRLSYTATLEVLPE